MDIRRSNQKQPDAETVERVRAHVRASQEQLVESNRPRREPETRPERVDRLDLSEQATSLRQLVARFEGAGYEVGREDVAALKSLYEAGQLNTPERIQRAAARLLSDS